SAGMSIVQLKAPEDQRGRVIGSYSMFGPGTRSFSGVTVGVLGSFMGIPTTVVVGGISIVAATVLAIAIIRRKFGKIEPGLTVDAGTQVPQRFRPEERLGAGGLLPHDDGLGGEPAVEQRDDLRSFVEVVGRVGEHSMKALRGRGLVEEGSHLFRTDDADVAEAQGAQVRLAHPGRSRVGLDERRRGRAAGERFHPQRSRARVQVQHPCLGDRIEVLQPREHRFADAVGGGPGAFGWHSQLLALGRAGDYSCHLRLSFVREAARSASPLVAAWVKRSAGAGPKTPIASHSGRPPRMMRSGPTEMTENAPGGIACPSGVVMSGADQSTGLR